jgi:FkbM family methyltransferase
VRLLRDASWIFSPQSLEPEIRTAFALALNLLQPATFWDIGANIGFYSWLVRRHPGVRQVIMFEPDPINFALITRTIDKNAVSDCQAMNVALSDQPGNARFLVDHASGATGSLEVTSDRENKYSLHHAYQMNETISCQTVTVDGLIAASVPPPDLIKIDVEGAEHLVIAGAKAYLARHHPTMIIETSNADLVRRLVDGGYTAFWIDSGNLLFISTKNGADLAPFGRTFPKHDRSA